MYYCENCGHYFERPKRIVERYGMPHPWGQQFDGCPRCGVAGMIGEVDEDDE